LGLNDGNCAKDFYAKCKLQDEYETISSGIIIVAFNVMQSAKLKMNTKQLASAS
jgi:multisubunit Na+/H+ antiporter MnhG subunit